jgi:hypothetical protein
MFYDSSEHWRWVLLSISHQQWHNMMDVGVTHAHQISLYILLSVEAVFDTYCYLMPPNV